MTLLQVEEQPTPKHDIFEVPDISQPLPTRGAAKKATDKLQEIAKEQLTAVKGPSCSEKQSPSTSPQPQVLMVEVGVQATVSMETKEESGEIKYEPSHLELDWSDRDSVVVPGYTNAQVSDFRKMIARDGSVKCPIEVCMVHCS